MASNGLLNEKQTMFVREYLVDLNATQAAIRAGYSEDSAGQIGHELLKKPEIQAVLSEFMRQRAERTRITADRVLEELGRIAFARITSVATWNESGVRTKPSEELTEDDAAAIQEVSETVNEFGGSVKVKLHDKVRALEMAAKHLGLMKDGAADQNKPAPMLSYRLEELDEVADGEGDA